MIAVLVDSRHIGSSGWVAVRHTQKVRVYGIEGNTGGALVQIHVNNDHKEAMVCSADSVFGLPTHATRIMAKIVKINEESRISVDLE